MTAPIRVLIVDDSAFARKVVREILQAALGIEVVGFARDGLEAIELIATLKPDVLSLDLVMPNLDGIGVLRSLNLLPEDVVPRVVVVSMSNEDTAIGAEALQLGAITILQKPTALATDQLYELRDALVAAVREAALARHIGRSDIPQGTAPAQTTSREARLRPVGSVSARHKLLVIGTSTGGPQALSLLMAALPADFPLPIAIVLHIPASYTADLARRLDHQSELTVVEADDGLIMRPGLAVLARGGLHMTLAPAHPDNALTVQLSSQPFDQLHKPSVDVLFESAARHAGGPVLGVVLTGMGNDGLRGAGAIVAAGGHVLTEAESSCVVYGMPAVVKNAGLSHAHAPLDEMARLIIANL